MSTAHDDAVDRAGAPTEALALPTVEPTKALLAKMFETIENIGKAEDHLQRKIDAELATAEKFDAAGEEREALQCLEKKKMYERQLACLGTSKMNLETQKLTMESMKMYEEVLDAQRVAAKAMQKQIKEMGDRAGAPTEALALPTVEPTKALLAKMFETIENIGKAEDHLQRKIDAELATAEKFDAAGEEREALQCLEKREMYEQQLMTLGTSKMNLDRQKLTMESMKMNAEILDASRVAAKSIQMQIKQMGGVDKVEELMDEVEDVRTRGVSILSELISGMISELIMLDGELQCLEKKEKYEQRLTTLGTSKNMFLEYHKMILEKHAVLEHELNDFAALREAKKAKQKQVKTIGGVDKVEELMDELEDLRTLTSEVKSELTSDLMLYGIDADAEDDELLAELVSLMEEELAADLSKVNLGIIDAQRVAAKAMQEQVKQVGGVDKVEELMDEVEDAQTDAREIQEAMGRQLEVPGVGDGRAVEMPSAQKRGGKAGFLEQLRKRIMGVARSMMRLRQVIPLKMGACWSVVPNKAARNPAKEVMAKLNEIIENIGKKEDHLQRKIDAELATAKKFHAAGKKREALQCLKKRKMYEQQLMTLGTSKMNLETQKLTMESMKMNAEILDAQRVAAKSMQEEVKQMGGVDKVEELRDGLEEVHTDAREIGDATNREVEGIEADDDEHFADSSKVELGLGRAVEMPSAPISLPAAGTKKIMTEEERELAELEASMAG